MSLQKQIMEELKTAMKSKDVVALQALRAVKSALFDEQERTQLLAGLEVDGCVDLEAFYHRKTKEEAIA